MATKKNAPAKQLAAKVPTTKTVKYSIKREKEIIKSISEAEKSQPLTASPNGSDLCKIYDQYGSILKAILTLIPLPKKIKRIPLVFIAALDANCAAMPEE